MSLFCSQGVCESDYLKISGWGKKCGYIGAERLPERLELDRQELKMQFVSDFLHEARGFWIQITGIPSRCNSLLLDDRGSVVSEEYWICLHVGKGWATLVPNVICELAFHRVATVTTRRETLRKTRFTPAWPNSKRAPFLLQDQKEDQ